MIERSGSRPEWLKLPKLPLVVTDSVWDELVEGPRQKGETGLADQTEAWLRAVVGQPTVIPTDSAEARVAAALLMAPGSIGIGEASIIGYTLTHPEHVAVLLDRRALWQAVEELRGARVMSMHGFLAEMVASHSMPQALANVVSETLLKRQTGTKRPSWWPIPASAPHQEPG